MRLMKPSTISIETRTALQITQTQAQNERQTLHTNIEESFTTVNEGIGDITRVLDSLRQGTTSP